VVYEINAFSNRSGQVVSSQALQPGKAHIVLDLVPESTPAADAKTTAPPLVPRGPRPGTAKLTINGQPEGEAQFANVNGSSNETLDIGSDLGSPVSTEYQTPNRFVGKIDQVTIELK
jgi:hypothetical protein